MSSTWENLYVKTKPALTVDSPFPWGKHVGTPINRVPRDYLEWAYHDADKMRPELRAVVAEVLGLPAELPLAEADPAPVNGRSMEVDCLERALKHGQARIRKLEQEVADLKAESTIADRMKISDIDKTRAVIKQFYRAMSLVHHPDRPGGSKDRQAVVNACYADIMRRLEGDDR